MERKLIPLIIIQANITQLFFTQIWETMAKHSFPDHEKPRRFVVQDIPVSSNREHVPSLTEWQTVTHKS